MEEHRATPEMPARGGEKPAAEFSRRSGDGSASPGVEGAGHGHRHYKIPQLIGEGGFGNVYMAQQTEPVKRRVALRIVKPGMDSEQVIGRFESERQALAMMDHANIARVYDAGATGTGRPYFVMKLVRACRSRSIATGRRSARAIGWTCSSRCARRCSSRT